MCVTVSSSKTPELSQLRNDKEKARLKNGKSNDDCIKSGFTLINKNGINFQHSVICHEVMSNDAIRLTRLEHHLSTKYNNLRA